MVGKVVVAVDDDDGKSSIAAELGTVFSGYSAFDSSNWVCAPDDALMTSIAERGVVALGYGLDRTTMIQS